MSQINQIECSCGCVHIFDGHTYRVRLPEKPKEGFRRCNTCQYHTYDIVNDLYECHRRSPGADVLLQAVWPRVAQGNSCGEWRPISKTEE